MVEEKESIHQYSERIEHFVKTLSIRIISTILPVFIHVFLPPRRLIDLPSSVGVRYEIAVGIKIPAVGW